MAGGKKKQKAQKRSNGAQSKLSNKNNNANLLL
jgi:hypothetical protein